MKINEVLQDIILNMPIKNRITDGGFDVSHPIQDWYCVAYPVMPEQLDYHVSSPVWVIECFDHGKYYAGKWCQDKESAIIFIAKKWAKKFGQLSYSWIDEIIETGDLVIVDNKYCYVVGNDTNGIHVEQFGENCVVSVVNHDNVFLARHQNMLNK